jgi:hypothetical protein
VNKKDYAKLKYPIHLLKKGESVFDLSDIKPLRKQFEEQTGLEQEIGLDPEFVMKYIILMNAYGSPAIEKYPHLGKRKTWVLSELDVHPNANNKYEDKYNYLTLNKIPEILMKIQLFRSIQKPVDFAIMLHAEEELFWLNQPIDPDRRNKEQASAYRGNKKTVRVGKGAFYGLFYFSGRGIGGRYVYSSNKTRHKTRGNDKNNATARRAETRKSRYFF